MSRRARLDDTTRRYVRLLPSKAWAGVVGMGHSAPVDEFVTLRVAEFALVGAKKFFRGPNLVRQANEITHCRRASCTVRVPEYPES